MSEDLHIHVTKINGKIVSYHVYSLDELTSLLEEKLQKTDHDPKNEGE
jgi:predicted house-cleaning noncanonical NTP pyrophosphatase (MazG superfamily)